MFATVTGLSSCATGLSTRAPKDVDLGGEWQIDLALSDFPQEAVAAPDPLAGSSSTQSQSNGGQGGGRGGRGGGGGGGRGGRGGGMGGGGMGQGNGLAGGPNRAGSPEHHFAMPPHLSIAQSVKGLDVDITMPDGKHANSSYVSGEKSVVTTTRGPANRTLGWDGDDFVILTKAGDKGPQSEVRYSLDRDGSLMVISTISNAGIYDFQYTLEYTRVVPP